MGFARACLSLTAGLLILVLAGGAGLAAGNPPVPTTTPSAAAYGVTASAEGSSASVPMPIGRPGNWSLLFEDNFEILNRKVWTPYWFNDCAGSMMNKVLTCSGNVSVLGGELRLQMSAPGKGALVATNPSDGAAGHAGASFGLGFFEARILFPGTCGATIHNWPAWWTTGQSWPTHGENDIAEPLSGTMHSNYHSPSRNITLRIPGCWAGQFHTYGLHRQAGRNDIYFDGTPVHSYTTQDGGAPHYLVINVGYWSGSQVFGAAGAVRVDYVRVWK